MPPWFAACMRQVSEILERIDDAEAVQEMLAVLEAPPLSLGAITGLQLYAETLPRAQDCPLSPARRHIHFLWDAFDKLPVSYPRQSRGLVCEPLKAA